jgi:hypothetical protein
VASIVEACELFHSHFQRDGFEHDPAEHATTRSFGLLKQRLRLGISIAKPMWLWTIWAQATIEVTGVPNLLHVDWLLEHSGQPCPVLHRRTSSEEQLLPLTLELVEVCKRSVMPFFDRNLDPRELLSLLHAIPTDSDEYGHYVPAMMELAQRLKAK